LSKLAALADEILAIYQGPFMGQESEESWYLSLRERLRNRFVRCMADLNHRMEQLGKWEDAVAYYQRSLEADPLAEGIYRHLMVCYQKLGRRAEALEVYNRCRNTLRASLDVEPSAETRALYDNLLRVA
jgi:DNA-binding SARP family transcriptional activator